MTLEETSKILAIVCEMYPMFLKDRNPEVTAAMWQRLFADEPYELVEAGLIAFISTDTKGFPPSVGAIKEQIGQLAKKDEPTELEAWNSVVRAIGNSIYNADSEFAKLSPTVREIVGTPGQLREWAMMDADEVYTVIGSHFQRSYRARVESEKRNGMLPSGIRERLGFGRQHIASDGPTKIGEILGIAGGSANENYQNQRL